MTIYAYNDVSDFDVNNGVINTTSTYNNTPPAFDFDAGDSLMKSITQFRNDVLRIYLRPEDVTATIFRILVGCDVSGNGQAIQVDMSSSAIICRHVTTTTIDGNYASVLKEKNVTDLLKIENGKYYEFRVEIVGSRLRSYIQNKLVIDSNLFTTGGGGYFGFCNVTGSSKVYVSDVQRLYNQIIYGNVNLNGAPDENGVVFLYNQSTYEVVAREECDENGNYMIFIDDDPINGNKYFLYGYIENLGIIQPRGVLNITI